MSTEVMPDTKSMASPANVANIAKAAKKDAKKDGDKSKEVVPDTQSTASSAEVAKAAQGTASPADATEAAKSTASPADVTEAVKKEDEKDPTLAKHLAKHKADQEKLYTGNHFEFRTVREPASRATALKSAATFRYKRGEVTLRRVDNANAAKKTAAAVQDTATARTVAAGQASGLQTVTSGGGHGASRKLNLLKKGSKQMALQQQEGGPYRWGPHKCLHGDCDDPNPESDMPKIPPDCSPETASGAAAKGGLIKQAKAALLGKKGGAGAWSPPPCSAGLKLGAPPPEIACPLLLSETKCAGDATCTWRESWGAMVCVPSCAALKTMSDCGGGTTCKWTSATKKCEPMCAMLKTHSACGGDTSCKWVSTAATKGGMMGMPGIPKMGAGVMGTAGVGGMMGGMMGGAMAGGGGNAKGGMMGSVNLPNMPGGGMMGGATGKMPGFMGGGGAGAGANGGMMASMKMPNMPGGKMPSMPGMPNMPGLPSVPGMPNMPGLPSMPGLPKGAQKAGGPPMPRMPGKLMKETERFEEKKGE